MDVVIVIPARYGSTRLPGKPLLEISGKPMIQHVYERGLLVPNIRSVVVATDDVRIMEVVQRFGGRCLLTSTEHPSGTDRLVEVMSMLPADIYVNLQGDEPLIQPSDVGTLVAGMLSDPFIEVATLCHNVSLAEANSPSTVKVVVDSNGDALYFSRSLIPYARDAAVVQYLKHMGIYGYRRKVLEKYNQLPDSLLEQAEKLEQLRLLEAGIRIRTFRVESNAPGVDTAECLEKVRRLMMNSSLL
jgi:3-deoxy-manno-octulosonate cytidylyltransferase (CMP-KDO synthetase)